MMRLIHCIFKLAVFFIALFTFKFIAFHSLLPWFSIKFVLRSNERTKSFEERKNARTAIITEIVSISRCLPRIIRAQLINGERLSGMVFVNVRSADATEQNISEYGNNWPTELRCMFLLGQISVCSSIARPIQCARQLLSIAELIFLVLLRIEHLDHPIAGGHSN